MPGRSIAVASAVTVVALGGLALREWVTTDVALTGVENTMRSGPVSEHGIRVWTERPADTVITVDGRMLDAVQQDGALVVHPVALADGPHELSVSTTRALRWLPEVRRTVPFAIDDTAPELHVDEIPKPAADGPVTITGHARDAVRIEAAGQHVTPSADGSFTARVTSPDRQVPVIAVDAAGNRTEQRAMIHSGHPGMRAVHLTGMAWANDGLRESVLDMARQGLIDTVELDLKDEAGEVTYDSAVPLAREIGAVKGYYRAREAVDQLHSMGVRVVGRLVAFKDPVLGEASWRSGHPERVVRNASGAPWSGGYGDFAFTNFADPVVSRYNVDLAAEAADLGFDDVLYDYVRRPDGDVSGMRFAGLTTSTEDGIVDFLRRSQEALRESGTMVGASVFGIAVDRPHLVAQDIGRMAEHVDYIAPMIYPSHWGAGEFGVADPDSQPYDIVRASVAAFNDAVRGTGATIIPWLQDFSLGTTYGPGEVAAQIDATRDAGSPSFLLWSPNCRYHEQGLIGG